MSNIGFTLDENILHAISMESYLDDYGREADFIEIAPDTDLLSVDAYMEAVKHYDFHHIHVPYFVDRGKYDFAHPNYQKHFESLFTIVDVLRQHSIKKPSIVLHEATASSNESKELTRRGIDYLLNFIVRKNLDVNLALEYIGQSGSFAESPQSTLEIVKSFDTDQMIMCYDIAHDYYRQQQLGFDLDNLSEHVGYMHLHGKGSRMHQSIRLLPDWILKQLPCDLDINIEILVSTVQNNYLECLKKDIACIKKTPSGR